MIGGYFDQKSHALVEKKITELLADMSSPGGLRHPAGALARCRVELLRVEADVGAG